MPGGAAQIAARQALKDRAREVGDTQRLHTVDGKWQAQGRFAHLTTCTKVSVPQELSKGALRQSKAVRQRGVAFWRPPSGGVSARYLGPDG